MADLVGTRFGRLLVLEEAQKTNGRKSFKCQCECGNTMITLRQSLVSGNTKSCGCLLKEKTRGRFTTHGQSRTRLYSIYRGMLNRCYKHKTKRYERYGGRGIRVCNEWVNDFKAFYRWAMVNGYRNDLTIDRIDVNGDYAPGNCRWSNVKMQQNNLSTNKIISYMDQKKTLARWCQELNLNYHTIFCRLNRNWTIERAFKTPIEMKKGT